MQPERLNEEISNDDKDMIYADTKQEIATKRTAFIRKRRLERVLKKVKWRLEDPHDTPPRLITLSPTFAHSSA